MTRLPPRDVMLIYLKRSRDESDYNYKDKIHAITRIILCIEPYLDELQVGT